MSASDKKWVAAWGAPVSHVAPTPAVYCQNETFRYVIFSAVAGTALRLHFSNAYGDEPVTVQKTFVALRTEKDGVDVSTNVRVTFGGKGELVIPAHGEAVSDEVPFTVTAGCKFSVSMYIKELTRLRTGQSNTGEYIRNYYGEGDYAEAAEINPETWGENAPYLFLHTIDVLTDAAADCRAIAAFGDSITARPWPDILGHNLFDAGITNRTVIRKAIGGGRILREYSDFSHLKWGAAGIRRFERDVLQAGVDRVFILHGINDIIHPGVTNRYCGMDQLPTAAEMIEKGYMYYINTARKHGLKVYLGTLLACPRCLKDDGVREQIRLAVNAWIRKQAPVDGVIDFEAATWDENDHQQLNRDCDCGDHLHPSLEGSRRMAACIPVSYCR